MLIVKRSFFTLLETLVVFTILSMGIALTGVKLKQAYQEQRVNSDVQQVVNSLRMAQDLMLLMNADAEVVLTQNLQDKIVTCQINVEKPLSKQWEKIAERTIKLTAIRSFRISRHEENPLRIQFIMGKMTEGTLMLSSDEHVNTLSKDKNKNFRISLKGYPSPIALSDKEVDDRDRYQYASEGQQLYPEEVYEELYVQKKA